MSWIDDDAQPERDLDDLRALVATRAGRIRNRRRLAMATGAVAVTAALLVVASLPGGDAKPRQLQAADRPDTSTTVDPSLDGTLDPSAVYGEEPTTTVPGQTTSTTRRVATTTTTIGVTATTGKPSVRTSPAGMEDCTRDGGERHVPASNEEFATAMTQVWLLCAKPSIFSTDEDGLELRPDGTWYKLVRDVGGGLVRLRELRDHGTWAPGDTMDDSVTEYVAFHFDDGGLTNGHAIFASKTSKVQLNNNGVWIADYIHAPPGTVVTG